MTPLERYERELARRGFSADSAQRAAVASTQSLFDNLVAEHARRKSVIGRLLRSLPGRRTAPFRGLYLWGGVGRGKTWILDSFYECLPFAEKQRLHFHRFMQHVHQELKLLGEIADPLQVVADRFAERAIVVCFDEFHVSDITDAMLLGGLLRAMFDRGVTLVATSNEEPSSLYRGGLQRERFLPAIALLEQYTQTVNVDSAVDYRMRYLDRAEIYHCGLGEEANRILNTHFENIAPEEGSRGTTVEIEGRRIPIVRRADSVVWFNFDVLCGGPRGPADYIEIARQFQTVLLGNVPRLSDAEGDSLKRFITLIDECYDRNVRLIASAAAAPAELYAGGRLAGPFQRTASRLIEMQSRAYLERPHRSD